MTSHGAPWGPIGPQSSPDPPEGRTGDRPWFFREDPGSRETHPLGAAKRIIWTCLALGSWSPGCVRCTQIRGVIGRLESC